MHRQKGIEYYNDKDGREKSRIKEFLTYGIRLEGVDFLGNPLKCGLEFEGRCPEPRRRVRVKMDEHGRKQMEYVMQGFRQRFYIPFSKKTVDDL